MDRKQFIKSMALLPLISRSMNLKDLNKMTSAMSSTGKMPVLFLGHGSPMNAIEENEFVSAFKKLGKELVRPNAILCISAHWETKGTFVTAMQNPPTIHDFGGFPQALFDVQYPAKGSPKLAQETKNIITKTEVGLDDKGVLIIGSGNIVHNLGMVAWKKLNEEFAFDWAIEANEKMKNYILSGDHQKLIDFKSQGKAFDLAIPTPEHYLPLLYTLALKEENEKITLFNDKAVGGSLSMTSLKIESA